MSDVSSVTTLPAVRMAPGAMPLREEQGPVALSRILGALGRKKKQIALLTVLFAVPLAALSSLVPAHYEATATVRIDLRQPQSETEQSELHANTDAVAIRTQVDILGSTTLARDVVAKLNLQNNPEFGGGNKRPGLIGGLKAGLKDVLRQFGLAAPDLTPEQKLARVVDQLGHKMTFVSDERSYVIGIRAKTNNPELSAAIANAYSTAYINYTVQQKIDAISRANVWFDQSLKKLQDKMREANAAVAAMRLKTGLIQDPAAANGSNVPVTIAAQQMAQINSQLVTAAADRADKEATYRQAIAALSGRASLDSIPAVVQSPSLQQLRPQAMQLDAEVANRTAIRGQNYPDVQSLIAARDATHQRIDAQVHAIADSLAAEARAARAREQTLRAELNVLKGQVSNEDKGQVAIRDLQSEADTAKTLYLNYLSLYQKTANLTGLEKPDANLVSSAVPPLSPAIPTPPQLMIFSFFIGLLAAAFCAVRDDIRQDGFRSAEELESQMLLPTLGTVPSLTDRVRGKERDGSAQFDDAISLIRGNLLRQGHGKPPKVILVTSALPREGKTLLAVSLANNAQAAGQSALVIDCNVRQSAASQALAGQELLITDNLTDTGQRKIGQTNDAVARMTLARAAIGNASPQDFFASADMRQILEKARGRYDLVILDAPSVLMNADARILASLADTTLLVVRWLETPRKIVANALAILDAQRAQVAGLVLNGVVVSKLTASESSFAYIQRHHPTPQNG